MFPNRLLVESRPHYAIKKVACRSVFRVVKFCAIVLLPCISAGSLSLPVESSTPVGMFYGRIGARISVKSNCNFSTTKVDDGMFCIFFRKITHPN
jgi:hypothetical protein